MHFHPTTRMDWPKIRRQLNEFRRQICYSSPTITGVIATVDCPEWWFAAPFDYIYCAAQSFWGFQHWQQCG